MWGVVTDISRGEVMPPQDLLTHRGGRKGGVPRQVDTLGVSIESNYHLATKQERQELQGIPSALFRPSSLKRDFDRS